MNKKPKIKLIGIDPGEKGGIVFLNGGEITFYEMRLDKDKLPCFDWLQDLFWALRGNEVVPVFLEQPVSFGMGTKGAFTYGRGYQNILNALENAHLVPTLLRPAVWTKLLHEGLDDGLKAKVKSEQVFKKLFSKYWERVQVQVSKKRKKPHDGLIDAALIAEYGRRQMLNGALEEKDFY